MSKDTYELLKDVTKVLGRGTYGFRTFGGLTGLRPFETPLLSKVGKTTVVDVAMFKSPIFGMGIDQEDAAADAIARGPKDVYAYHIKFSEWKDKAKWPEKFVNACVESSRGEFLLFPEQKIIAAQSSVSLADIRYALKSAKVVDLVESIHLK